MFNEQINNVIILDDIMDEATKYKCMASLFTRWRHDNRSVIFLTQNLIHKNQRRTSLNSDYLVIFKNPRDRTQFTHLAKQLLSSNYKFLTWAYEDVINLRNSVFCWM